MVLKGLTICSSIYFIISFCCFWGSRYRIDQIKLELLNEYQHNLKLYAACSDMSVYRGRKELPDTSGDNINPDLDIRTLSLMKRKSQEELWDFIDQGMNFLGRGIAVDYPTRKVVVGNDINLGGCKQIMVEINGERYSYEKGRSYIIARTDTLSLAMEIIELNILESKIDTLRAERLVVLQ